MIDFTIETRGVPILKHPGKFKPGNIIYLPFKDKNEAGQTYELVTVNGQFMVYPQTDKTFLDQGVYLEESQGVLGLIPFQIKKELKIDSSSKKSYSGIVNWCEPANQEDPYFHGEQLNIVIDANMQLLCLDIENLPFEDLNPQNSLGKFLSSAEIQNLINILKGLPPKTFEFSQFSRNPHLRRPILGYNESLFYYEISQEKINYDINLSPYQIMNFEIPRNKCGPALEKKLENYIKTILRNKTITNFQWHTGNRGQLELVIQLK